MIILGDLASPNNSFSEVVGKVISDNPRIFEGKRIICNFEGLIYDGSELKLNEPILYNHSSILRVLKQGGSPVLCLANNHVLDLPAQFESTISQADAEGILSCGAGKSRKEAEKPVLFTEGDRTVALFNVCWDFLLYNHKNPRSGIHVAELKEQKLLDRIRKLKSESPEISVIVYIHWSLDLEILPFPMYRQLSRDLVSAGTDLVVGAHSHCVQGGESYENGFIVYGLGNFLIPDDAYAGGNLSFPAFAKLELALEWDMNSNKVLCHWFEYENSHGKHHLEYLGSDDFESSERLRELSPYRAKSDRAYLTYFKKNRRKKILIPVYRDYRRKFLNSFYTGILKTRARTAHFLARIKLIKWQN